MDKMSDGTAKDCSLDQVANVCPAYGDEGLAGNGIPLKWRNTAFSSWKHILPYLSLADIHALSQAGEIFQMIVDLFFASGKVVVDGAFLKRHSPENNLQFYRYIGGLATKLEIRDTLRGQDLAPLLSCFPQLAELTLRRVRKVGDLNSRAMKKLYVAADIVILNPGWCGEMNCPNLESFSFDAPNKDLVDPTLKILEGSSKMLNTLVLRNCPQEIGLLGRFANLKLLSIMSPIEDTEKWSEIKRLRSRLETWKCCFSIAPLEKLPDECLIKIFSFLSTEDFIALSHTSQRFREIIFQDIYPRAEIKLLEGFRRYPLKKCVQIHEALAQRVKKIRVEGYEKSLDLFSHLSFPNMRSLKISCLGATLSDSKGIPSELETFHVDTYFPNGDFFTLLGRLEPTLQELRVRNSLSSSPLPNLRKFATTGSVPLLHLIEFLKKHQNLVELDVSIENKADTDLASLLEIFKNMNRLKILRMNLKEWTGKMFPNPTTHPILPRLSELSIRHRGDPDQNNCLSNFLKSIRTFKMKKICIGFPLDEIKRFEDLEFLQITVDLDIKTVLSFIEALPKLREFKMENTLSFPEGMKMISYLMWKEREMIFNGMRIACRRI